MGNETRIIASGRQAGKTMALIELCAREGGYIVCHSKDEAVRVFHKAREMGYRINQPLSYAEFVNGEYYGKGVRQVYIDNVMMLLNYLSGVPIRAVTLTLDDVYLHEGDSDDENV